MSNFKTHRDITNEDQRSAIIQLLVRWELPFQIKIGPVVHPGTLRQINYLHHLCSAYGKHYGLGLENAKNECKIRHGIWTMYTSPEDGERRVVCKSFAKYTKEERSAFATKLEEDLSDQGIPFIPSDEK